MNKLKQFFLAFIMSLVFIVLLFLSSSLVFASAGGGGVEQPMLKLDGAGNVEPSSSWGLNMSSNDIVNIGQTSTGSVKINNDGHGNFGGFSTVYESSSSASSSWASVYYDTAVPSEWFAFYPNSFEEGSLDIWSYNNLTGSIASFGAGARGITFKPDTGGVVTIDGKSVTIEQAQMGVVPTAIGSLFADYITNAQITVGKVMDGTEHSNGMVNQIRVEATEDNDKWVSASGNYFIIPDTNTYDNTGGYQGLTGYAEDLGSGDTNLTSGIAGYTLAGGSGTKSSASGITAYSFAQDTATVTQMNSLLISSMLYGGTPTVDNAYGINVPVFNDYSTSGVMTRQVGIAVGETGFATNSTNLLLGTTTIPTGDYNIYSPSTRDSYIAGGIRLDSSVDFNVTTVNSATYDLLASDNILHVTYSSTSAVTSLTLPTAHCNDSNDYGRIITIKDAGGNAGTNNITVDTQGSETIDGSATVVLNADYVSIDLYCEDDDWFIK